jgi:hypothetical protein
MRALVYSAAALFWAAGASAQGLKHAGSSRQIPAMPPTRIINAGDSYEANGSSYKLASWIAALSKQTITFNPASDYAVSGTGCTYPSTTGQSISQLPRILADLAANGPAFVLLSDDDNNYNQATPAATVSCVTSMLSQIVSAGGTPVLVMKLVRCASGYSAGLEGFLNQVYQGYRQYIATHPGIYLYDPNPFNTVATTGYGNVLNMQADCIHPNVIAVELIASGILAMLTPQLNGAFQIPRILDAYNASTSPDGNYIGATGFMLSGGGSIASPVTGTVASGFSWSYSPTPTISAGTMVASLVPRTDGGQGQLQQFAVNGLTGGTAGDTIQAQQAYNITGASVGTSFEFTYVLNLTSVTSGFVGWQGNLKITDGTNSVYCNTFGTLSPWPQTALAIRDRVLCTVPAGYNLGSLSVIPFLSITLNPTSGATFTVQIGEWSLRLWNGAS